jgi:predicted lipoprotein with Yx(FWY)xxD motif
MVEVIRGRAALVGTALVVAVAAACGGSSSSTSTASTPAPTPTPLVSTATATVAGKSETILVDGKGMTLYYYLPDKGGQVTCTGQCAVAWPPLMVPSGQSKPTGTGLSGTLASVTSPAGGQQVTYHTWPLYGWQKDQKPGDTTGQGVGGKWFVATPDVQPGT